MRALQAVTKAMEAKPRCFGEGDSLLAEYHDNEWGRPVRDSRALFERLSLEAFQSGLSWRVILAKRPAFRQAFAEFEPETVAGFGPADIERLLADEGIVRNRRKIEAIINNAQALLQMQATGELFGQFLWTFTGGQTLRRDPRPDHWSQIPSSSPESAAMAKALKARGFRHIGPTTCYALMEATGMVDDHLARCFLAGQDRLEQREADDGASNR